MKFLRPTLIRLLLLLIGTSAIAQNYNYGVNKEVPALKTYAAKAALGSVIKLPANFNWNSIPSAYKNKIWEIGHRFDLKGKYIRIPENVTFRFKGGSINNGTIKGNETSIEPTSAQSVFSSLTLHGSYTNEYITPKWFGAKMDGKTDDRKAFVETLAHARTIGAKVMVDKDMFLNLEATGKKSIFLENNAWIEGSNDARIIVNNMLSPAFYASNTKNITIRNIEFLYDQKYKSTFGWSVATNSLCSSQLQDYLRDTKNITFKNSYPVWKSPIAFRSIFVLEAAYNVRFQNVTFRAKGKTADTFIQWAIKLKEQFKPNQVITNGKGNTEIPRKIRLQNVTLDGVIMGIQGIVDDFKSEGLRSYRYTDVQASNGHYVGGTGGGGRYWMPPPHLIYLNGDLSKKYNTKNITILNTIDYGEYVGTKNVRTKRSGYCNSLKLVDNIGNIKVDGYKSYRRDGMADLGNIKNSSFSNMYGEYDSSIFQTDYRYCSLRFLGEVDNTSFKNITLKDNAAVTKIYPLDVTDGNNVTMDNIEVSVNELATTDHGPFGINGSNNKVTNATLNIKKHTTTKPYRAVVFLDDNTRKSSGRYNHYEVKVNGWREIDSNMPERCMRMLLQTSSNSNAGNYAKITDVSNNFVSEQKGKKTTDTWKRSETVSLGNSASQKLKMDIPYRFTVKKITATTLNGLNNGLKVTLGTSTTRRDNLLKSVATSAGKQVQNPTAIPATKGTRDVVLNASGSFNQNGKVRVDTELVKSE